MNPDDPKFRVACVTGGAFQVNAYVLMDAATGDAAIIDTGDGTLKIAEAVQKLGAKPKLVILTHGHIDHAGGLAAVRRAFPGIPIVMAERDLPWIEGLPMQGQMFGLRVEPAPPPDRFLEDGEEIAVGNLKLRTIFTPGHTEGGASFLLEGEPLIFVGDTLFQGSVGRTDLPGGSFKTLVRSIRERLFPLGDEVVCHSGHGSPTTIGEERKHNPFLRPGMEEELGDRLA